MSTPPGSAPAKATTFTPRGRPRENTMAARARTRVTIVTWLLLLPAVIFLVACFGVPLLQLLAISFQGEGGPFSAYREILSDGVFRRVFLNTLQLAAVVTLISVLLAYPTAFVLSRLRGWRLMVALYCVLVPFWISVLVRTFSWMLLLERNGPVNTAGQALGLIDKPLKLLFNDFSVYVGMVHVLLPYAILPIYSAMLQVDKRLILASDGLGASSTQTFLKVYLPLTAGGVTVGAIFVFLMSLGFYITPALLGGLHNLTIAMLVDNFVSERLVWPLAAATSFILLFIILTILGIASRFVAVGRVVTVQ